MEVGSDGRNFRVFLVILLLQRSLGCQDSPVGIADSSIIPDIRFTATSHYDNQYLPKNARLNGAAIGWGPLKKTDPNDYLQIDLGEVYVICAVATQGRSDDNEWTEQYKISTSIDNNTWTTYKDGNQDKLFTGNSDFRTVVKNVLDIPTLTRYIRFIPTTYHNWKVLRVEAYGLRKDLFSCRSVPVGIGNGKIPDSSMTSSTTYNSTTSPSKARLGYTAGSSWCAATSDSSPYLQINLGSPYIICGIATQGDHMTDQWIQSYQINVSTDGTTFNNYMENSQVRSFDGNFNSNTVVNNVLYDGTIGQYIRVTPTSHYGTTNCMRTELYGIQQTGGCTSMAVGLSYSSIIPDRRFTASSYYDERYRPNFGRLITSNKAWAPKTVSGAWLQIDLGSLVYVCAVATQGGGTHANEWATEYKIRVSLDNVNWNYYQENNIDKVFTGNTDNNNVVTNNLINPTKAKFIRFYPTASHLHPTMRAEVYGIPSACNSPVGLEDSGVIQNDRMTSSSHLDNTHTASRGRLYGNSSWCSSTSSNTEYIQINLEQVMTVTGIATQGDHTMDKWVKTYTISYSMDGNLWNTYKAGLNSNKVLQGNSDRSSIVVRWLSHPLTARHVKVTPQTWNTAICMRMELYGCNYATRPVISGLTNQNLTAAANSYVDLVCIVQEPLIQYIKWYTGNTDITSQSTGLVSGVNGVKTSTLRINYTSVDDVLNTYDCFRSNSSLSCYKPFMCRANYGKVASDGDGIKSAGVKIRCDYPSTMATPTVDNIQSTSVTVRWTQPVLRPSQATVTSYVILYQKSSSTQTINVSPPAVSHVITGLAIYTNYSVKIRAVSKVCQGEWSQARNFRTDSALPVVSPASVAATSLTSQSIRVTWQTPSSGVNGLLLGYRLSYAPISGSAKVVNINAGNTGYNITSLNKWTEYRITVKCYNDKGDGPSAEVVVRTLEDAPSDAPGQFSVTGLSSTSVRLSWSLPPINSRNGIIRGFEVYYKKTGSSQSAIIKDLPGISTLTYTITGLGKYTTYTFKVLAYTKPNMKGPYSNEKEETTEQDAPSAPTNLQTTEIAPQGSTGPQVKLTWDPPSSPNGIIQYYIVSYSYSQGSPAVYKTNVTGALTVTLPVFGGKTYWFSVQAVTIKEGSQITKEVAVQVYAPSQAPGNFNAIVQSSTSVLLSWSLSPINSRNGIIRGFEVYYKKNGSSESAITKDIPGNSTLVHTITGLGKYTTYTFKVLAYTELNKKGPYSNSIDKRTMQDAPSAPTNFQTTEIAPNGSTGPQAKLTWDQPSSPNGIIQYYIVSYSYSQSLPPVYKTNVTGVFTVTLPVFGGKTYWFSVQAVTIKEGNRTTKEVVIQVYAPSQAPGNFDVAVLSSTSVQLSWSLQPINSRNGIVRGFEVYYKKTDGSESAITKDLPGNSTLVHTITGLGKYTTYTFKVLAYTEPNKKGPYSNSIDKTTEQDAPSVPTNLQTSEIAPNGSTGPRVKLTWDPPSSPNGIIQYYVVSYSYSQSLPPVYKTNVTGALTITLPVFGGKTYWFSVQAVTIKEGNRTTKEAVIQVYAPSEAPGNFDVAVLSSTSVRLSWSLQPINSLNGIVRGFEVYYKKTDGSESAITKDLPGNSTLVHTITGLGKYTTYTFKVLAYTEPNKKGPYSNSIDKTTEQDAPSVPTNLQTSEIAPNGSTGPRVKLTWDPPSSPNGIIQYYIVSYNKSRPSSTLSVINVTDISGVLNVTLPVYGGVTYLFSVKAVTIKQGEQTTKIFNVKVYAPTTAPKTVGIVEHNATTFTVQWEPLNTNNGPVTIYELSKTLKQDSSRSKRALPVEPEKINATCCNATLYKLPPCSQYSISVRAYASAGPGPFSTKLSLRTSEPLPPDNLAITHVGKREVTLQWKEPPSLTKPVEEYKISFNGTNLYEVKVKIPDDTATSKDRTTTISNLHPATRYTFQVSAETECGMGKKSKQKPVDTKIDAPPPPDVTFISNITASTNNVSLWKASSRNGPVRAYQVIVVKGIDVPSFDEAKLTDYDKAQEDKLHYYIAAEIRTNSGEIFPKIFTIGDEKVYNGYKNMKLQEGKTYNVTQRALTRDEKLEVFPGPTVLIAKGKVPLPEVGGESGNKGSNTGAIATASVVVILIIAVLLVVAIVIWKRRKRGENKRKNTDDLDNALNLNDIPEETSRKVSPSPDSRTNLVDESPRGTNKQAGRSNGAAHSNDDTDLYGNADAIRHQPIPINKFSQYVNEKRTGDNSFHQEFKTLSNGQQFPWDKARLPNNKTKNRYANIITYDHSRVLLQESTDDSDYINASYIHGFDGTPRTYIASQGPIPSTVADFWLMVWQENVKTIVMLTNLVEAGRVKCHQYWPDSKEQHGPMTVTLHRSDVLADYVVRTLIVSKKGEEGKKQVQHYQYTSWPDKGVPQHATSVLGFRRKVRAQYASSGGGPLLVHCSAGVGRTGAFLAVDAMLERSKKDKTIDVFNYVQLMRNNRITMVQTDEQYAFVHYAVLEALTCGNTEVSALNLNIVLGKLSKPRPKDQMTGYDVEFKRLNYITPALITEDSSKTGRMEENMPRNRYPDIIPLDSARVFLSIEGQNYINASFANAYREKNAFIMTQAPMANTINDFWHMIFQYKIGSVVMLNALQEGNETFPQYLQSEGSQSYGDINIEVTSRETKGQLVITKCKLIHPMEPQTPHKFIHVHHTQWPDQSIPESYQSVLDLVTTVQKSQQQCGNTPVLVQCSDGVGRSGTFSAVYSLLERVKAEQVIDVFQAIKVLRLGRPNAVKTAEQYRFCYAMVQTYLNSFDDYANFSEV